MQHTTIDNIIFDKMDNHEKLDIGQFQPQELQDFLDIMNEAKVVFDHASLTEEMSSYYKKKFSDIQSLDAIDIKDPGVLKSYLAFKKLIKYKDKVSIKKIPGRFDETSPFLGEYSQYHEQVKNKSSFSVLENALYRPEVTFHIIPQEDREKANALGDKMLRSELAKYNTTPEETFRQPRDDLRNATYCSDLDNPWNDWNLQICLDTQLSQTNGEKYAPLGVIALHELGHVRQTMPGLSERDFEKGKQRKLVELAPTIDLIVRQDEIYKEIHNIPLKQKVVYPQKVLIADNSFEIGEIANTFRHIKQKYHLDNFEQVLLTKDAEEYISKLTGLQKGSQNLESTNEQNTNKLADLRKKIAHNLDKTLDANLEEKKDSQNLESTNEQNTNRLATLRKKITHDIDETLGTNLEEKKLPDFLKRKVEEPMAKIVDKVLSNKKVNE